MFNVKAERKGDKLTITVDLKETRGPSASGKTVIVATTEGNAKVEGEGSFSFGLNVWKPKS